MFKLSITFATMIILFVGNAFAQSNVSPIEVFGEYTVRIRTEPTPRDDNGVPWTTPIASAGLFMVSEPDRLLACVSIGPDETREVTIKIPATVSITPPVREYNRVEIRGNSYDGRECTGRVGPISTNATYIYFSGPDPFTFVE